MYLLFRFHNILPSQYRDIGYGERIVLQAFMDYQLEEMQEEIAALGLVSYTHLTLPTKRIV